MRSKLAKKKVLLKKLQEFNGTLLGQPRHSLGTLDVATSCDFANNSEMPFTQMFAGSED